MKIAHALLPILGVLILGCSKQDYSLYEGTWTATDSTNMVTQLTEWWPADTYSMEFYNENRILRLSNLGEISEDVPVRIYGDSMAFGPITTSKLNGYAGYLVARNDSLIFRWNYLNSAHEPRVGQGFAVR
jgi:hypothetical protein